MVVEREIVITNSQGLHARPAAIFVQLANKFDAEISVRKGEVEVNGKSIMGILMLGATKGSVITLRGKGADAQRAVDELGELLQNDTEPQGHTNA